MNDADALPVPPYDEWQECRFCHRAIGGGPGGWYSLASSRETCTPSPTTFHEPMACPICDEPMAPRTEYQSFVGRHWQGHEACTKAEAAKWALVSVEIPEGWAEVGFFPRARYFIVEQDDGWHAYVDDADRGAFT